MTQGGSFGYFGGFVLKYPPGLGKTGGWTQRGWTKQLSIAISRCVSLFVFWLPINCPLSPSCLRLGELFAFEIYSAASRCSFSTPPPSTSSFFRGGVPHLPELLQNSKVNYEKLERANLRPRSSKCLQHQHQFAELGRKKLEQAIQQLQEQLQLNVIQQTHLLQTADKKKASAPLQQLALQQQRLIQQLQITQSQYLLQQGLGLQGHNPSSGKREIIFRWLKLFSICNAEGEECRRNEFL